MDGTATGLGAFGFWFFVAAIIVAGIWNDARRRESQQETLRRIVECGKNIDPAVLDRILGATGNRNLERDLKVSGLIVLFIAPGLVALAIYLGQIASEARSALLGTSLLVGFVGLGLLLAAKLVERRYSDQQD